MLLTFATLSVISALSSFSFEPVNAQSSSSSITVQVGATASSAGGIFQFIPSNVTASNGTVITFEFSGIPGNHSVTQSSFADPCTPLSEGFDSGWVFLNVMPASTPTWNLTITDDTKPIWFFCKQINPGPHCVMGMVGAINPPTSGSNTFANFQKAAMAFTGTPGQQSVGELVGVGASASAGPVIPSGATLFGAPGATNTAPASSSSGSTSGTGSVGSQTTSASTGGASTTGSGTPTNGAVSILSPLNSCMGLSLLFAVIGAILV